MLVIQPRVSCMLGKQSTAELPPAPYSGPLLKEKPIEFADRLDMG